jgi:rSAM/selenodomain-associated transferase 2
MNKGAELSSYEILLFLHADTILPNNALLEIEEVFKEKDIVAGAFDLSFSSKTLALRIIAKVASWRSRITRLPYGDQAIFIKKDIFYKINKYDNIPLMEDINLMQKLKKKNFKIKISNKKVITSSRKWQDKGILYTTLRNWILVSLYYMKVKPSKLSKFYR